MLDSLNTPWKIWNELARWFVWPVVRAQFLINGVPWRKGWRFYGVPVIQKHRQSTMTFGPGLNIRSSITSNPLSPSHPVIFCTWLKGAVLQVGENFAMTGGTICATRQVIIGNNVAVGANSIITDTDFHPLDPQKRRIKGQQGSCEPVVIEDDVFIGMNCLILKGVRIGAGSCVGAGSVVTQDVLPGTIASRQPGKNYKIDLRLT